MTKLDRVLATFRHQETDRVPLYDLMLNDDCIEYFTGVYASCDESGAKAQAQAVDRMLDMARGVGCAPRKPSDQLLQNTDDADLIAYARYSDTRHGHHLPASHEEALARTKRWLNDARNWPSATDLNMEAENTRKTFERLHGWMGNDPVVCCLRQSGVGLDWLRADIGLEFFSYIDADDPGLISEYLELCTAREVAIIHAIADPRISPWALTYGDIATKNMLLHSPGWLRREFFPRLQRINDAYHEHGITCLFHSDGYLMEVSWGHKPNGAHPDILRQIEQRKAKCRREFTPSHPVRRRESAAT